MQIPGKQIFKNKMVSDAFKGVGAGVLAGLVIQKVNLPLGGFSQYVPLLAAYMAGGPIGLVGQFLVSGGLATISGNTGSGW